MGNTIDRSRPSGREAAAEPSVLPTDLRAGSILGRYELLLPIAKGGMAQVWAARLRGTRGFQKLVAVKTILANAIDSTRLEQMFLEEAQLASQIHHPNVVTTLELGEHDGTLYLVMEWVDGEPLSEVMLRALARGGMPLPIGVNLVGQACQGLHAAHTLRDDAGTLLGVVHRDVSPQNLLVTFSGTAKLVDFGIAKVTSKVSHLTEAGEVKGKFAYMAPEQVAGQAVDCRADLFALGITLYCVTTGKHPFRGSNPAETVRNICGDKPPPLPSSVSANYPPSLEKVVMKALEKAPDARFESANEMLKALEAALPGPLEASFDVKVAEYMAGLFGPRAAERRTAIRVAQEHADRQRTEGSSISAGTFRAISLDGAERTPVSSRSGRMLTSPGAEPPAFKRSLPSWAVPAGALVVACGVGFSLMARRAPLASPSAGPTPAAAAPAQPTAAAAVPKAVEAAPVSPQAADVDLDADAQTNDVGGDSRKNARTRKGARSGVTGRAAPHAGPAPAAATSATAAPAPAGPAAGTSAASPSATNAWDRQTFGGRF